MPRAPVTVRRCLTNAKPRSRSPRPATRPARRLEQIGRIVTAKLQDPVGPPDNAEITLRLVLPRAAP